MNKHVQAVKSYITSASGKEIIIGIAVILGGIGIVIAIVLLIQNSMPKIDYQPSVACNLLTKDEAAEMLGEDVLHSNPKNPTLSNDLATSKCSYTDSNPEPDNMLVAALAVRAGVTDKGVERNKAEFSVAKLAKDVEIVNDIGESAYYNPKLGQLNILQGRDWLIVSYGVGNDPQSNTLENAIKLSQRVLWAPSVPSF